jgi:hypothetical protein
LKQDICKMLEIDENHPDMKITAWKSSNNKSKLCDNIS